MDSRTIATEAFKFSVGGSSYVASFFADDITWEIAGLSATSRK